MLVAKGDLVRASRWLSGTKAQNECGGLPEKWDGFRILGDICSIARYPRVIRQSDLALIRHFVDKNFHTYIRLLAELVSDDEFKAEF